MHKMASKEELSDRYIIITLEDIIKTMEGKSFNQIR